MTQELKQPTYAELVAKLATMEKALANKAAVGTSMRIGEKGGLSVYGLGRFPVTLYASQWRKLIALTPEIDKFLTANADKLAEKGTAAADAPAAK